MGKLPSKSYASLPNFYALGTGIRNILFVLGVILVLSGIVSTASKQETNCQPPVTYKKL